MPVGEVIGVVASIIAIVQIADRIISLCKFYIQASIDTPSELQTILIEISTLKAIFEGLQFLETCEHATPALWEQLSGKDGPIEECRVSIASLEKLFPADQISIGKKKFGAKKRKTQLALATLAWPLKSHRARELLQKIIQQKATINLALTTESTQDIKSIKKGTKKIHDILTETQRQDVYRWLEKTDPTPIHNQAWKQHEPETSGWMLRSPGWTKWLAGDTRCLWVHGIPGAGKTILTSFLVERLKKHCKLRARSGYAYYYCYFGRHQDEAPPFLRWIIARLSRQANFVPELVYELYKQGGQPSLIELLGALEKVLQSFDIAYVIIDALDESKPRQDLLEKLRDLVTNPRFSKLRCLATSREYIDIEKLLKPISYSIPMSNPLIEQDIRKRVHHVLYTSTEFQGWQEDLLGEIEDAVVSGSKGMFRWAVCQLDRLRRLKSERHIIRKALKTLPKTLDETYERIFLDIPRDEWPFVYHALQWICFHQDMYRGKHPLSMDILLNAAETSTCKENPQANDLEYSENTLRNLLGCLVRVDENGCVYLAHYTVKEYLESQRISESAASYFRIGQEESTKGCLRILFQQAQDVDWDEDRDSPNEPYNVAGTPDVFLKNFAVYCVVLSLVSLSSWQSLIASEDSLLNLAVEFVNPALDRSQTIARVCWFFEINTDFFSRLKCGNTSDYQRLSWIEEPKSNDAWILLHLLLLPDNSSFPVFADAFVRRKTVRDLAQCTMRFKKQALDVQNISFSDFLFSGSLLQVMAQLSQDYHKSFRWLLSHCDTAMDSELLLSYAGFHHRHHTRSVCKDYCVLRKILGGQVDPNMRGYRITPLQIAVKTWDVEGVKALLEAGAEPNATGDTTGVFFETESILEALNDLHGLYPLLVCRNTQGVDKSAMQEIEGLLLQYDAKEFSSSA